MNIYFTCPTCGHKKMRAEGYFYHYLLFGSDNLHTHEHHGEKCYKLLPSFDNALLRDAIDVRCRCDWCGQLVLSMDKGEHYEDFSKRLYDWLVERGMYDGEEEEE